MCVQASSSSATPTITSTAHAFGTQVMLQGSSAFKPVVCLLNLRDASVSPER